MKRKLISVFPIVLLLCLVMGLQAEAAMKLNKTSATLIKGQTVQLKLTGTKKKVSWSSNSKSVATVSKNGKVTAKKKGSAVITAKSGKSYRTCHIRVISPSLNKKKATMRVGGTLMLRVKGTGTMAKWKSSKPSVATVSKAGLVTAKKKGTATITATVMKKKLTCKIKVKKADIFYVETDIAYVNVKMGQTAKIKATATDMNQKKVKSGFKWKSENNSVATVDANGVVTGKSIGSTYVICSLGGKKRSVRVAVEKDFDAAAAARSISYTSYKVDGGVIVTAKNNYKYGMNLTMSCLFRGASGEMIGVKTDNNYWFEPGTECALFIDDRFTNYLSKSSSYEISFTASDLNAAVGNAKKISVTSNRAENGVIAQVKNNGVSVKYSTISIVYTLKGTPVGYSKIGSMDCNNAGSMAYLTLNGPYGANHSKIAFDGYKIYVNNSYGYSWG